MPKTDIQLKIEDTISQIVHLKVVNAQLEETSTTLQSKYDSMDKMNKSMSKELRDIERLEGFSTKAIFHKILGSKEEQLEKERQEYLELTLKYEDLVNSIKLLEYEVNLLDAKVGSKEKLEIQLAKFKEKREQEIIHTDPKLREVLLDLSHKLENSYHLKKELKEAIDAGEICMNLMNQIVGHLQKVRNWGSFSNQNRGQMRRMMRRDAIDRARNLSYQVRHHLQLFDRELRDIGKRLNTGIDTAQFTDFTDFFFNNIITDWILQQKLTKALGSVAATMKEVRHILNYLHKDFEEEQNKIDQMKNQRDRILES